MAQVTITINNRPYTVACEDGQEPRLQELADALDREVAGLARAVGQIGDSRLLVISGLSLIDRLESAPAVALAEPVEAPAAPDNSQEIAALEARAQAAEEQAATLQAQLAEATQRIDALAAGLQGD
ncbi:cell division protein ZapA [Rhodospirillaceae bacterium KN72]|uniref:Cell division protein ZapA n=1 Tax=Pacificispira spongiicola TaxID=2729598 RepID=A0A7Y0HCT7_9PROT|nr:cell division protein ZapA [Pacificispira spongiicola]NMM42950.1 cell division protein ZapA [Pacificispira spongiicola]